MPYEATVPEDTPVGSTVFKGILVHDPDSVGETIEVKCINQPQVSNFSLNILKHSREKISREGTTQRRIARELRT